MQRDAVGLAATLKPSDETCVRCWSRMQAAERGNRVFVKREGERDGDGGANRSKSVKETPRPRERKAQSCSSSGDQTQKKMKMYSQAHAINQE